MINVLFVNALVILAATALMPGVMVVMNLATWCKTAPTTFLPQEHHATRNRSHSKHQYTHNQRGTDHTPIMVPDIGDISAGHSPATVPISTKAAALEGTPHAPLPSITAACTALWSMVGHITTCAMTPTGIVAPHPTLATSPTDITHATPQTEASLTSATPTKWHRNLSSEKPMPKILKLP